MSLLLITWFGLGLVFVIFWVRVLNRQIKRLRHELAQTRHSLAMYQTGNILAGLRAELLDAARAYQGLRDRHAATCRQLRETGFPLESLRMEEKGVVQPDDAT